MTTRKKVLIIDDEIDLCILLKAYFQRKDFEVLLSHSLADGLEKIRTYQPDILFIDNNLPDGTGWNLAPTITEMLPGAYINLISAYNPPLPPLTDTSRLSVYEKPISFADLDHRLHELALID